LFVVQYILLCFADDDQYIRENFLTLQLILDRQYMSYSHLNANYKLLLNSMTYLNISSADSYRVTNFGTLLSILFSVLLLSTFVVPFVEEKQNGLKEFLNLVTPMSFLNGLTFFLIRFVCYSAFLVATMGIAGVYDALGLGSHAYIIILYFLYIIANMSYAYLISVCFHSGKNFLFFSIYHQ